MREMVNVVFGEGKVVEWFDFEDGEKTPGTFEIETEAGLTTDILSKVSERIKNVKNTRSHIRRVKTLRADRGTVRVGSGTFVYTKIHVKGGIQMPALLSGGYHKERIESEVKGGSR